MFERTHKTAVYLALALACASIPRAARAVDAVQLSGAIAGRVTDSAGTPRMGAAILLYNRQERICDRALTDDRGEFKFPGLFPDIYSVRVTLAAFVPALRSGILVQPGMRSLLAVNLNALFSSIQLSYPPIENGSLMTDDWKWALRGSSSTRPVLRFAGGALSQAPRSSTRSAVFSETRGIVRVSAGDQPAAGIANEADLGAAFALATSVFGNNTLEVSGNLGAASQTGMPMAAFRTGYRRNGAEGGPEVSVTVRQIYLPGRLAAALAGAESPMPMLRSMSASFDDRTQIADHATLQYGFTMDSVSFLDRLNSFSPYARLHYSLSDGGELAIAYTSGNARPDLAGPAAGDGGLQRSLNSLGLFPRVSVRGGKPRIQRGEEYEASYSRKAGSRTYEASAFSETVTNAALTMVAPDGLYSAADVLADMFGGNSIFNAGDYRSMGYTAAVTQDAGSRFSATLMYGSMGALTAANREIESHNPDELRAMIRTGRKRAITARVAATAPGTGTHVIASYQLADNHWAMPGHLYSTQPNRPMPGLNVYFRQPVPSIFGRPCRVEITADLRNLLAQGYLPLATAGGQHVLLVETPRSFRGGLNFVF